MLSEPADVAVVDERREQIVSVAGHVLVDAAQPLDEPGRVVRAILVLPDLLDDLLEAFAIPLGRFGGDARGAGEVLDECSVEAVEDDEAVLVGGLFAQSRATPKHLLEQYSRLDGPQEDQELEVRDVDPGRQEVDGHDDAGVGAVAELADALEGPVDPASDLGHERVALAEDVARLIDELIGVRGVG